MGFWAEFNETPEYDHCPSDNRIRPIRWTIADFALFIYARNKNQISIHTAFRIARKHRWELTVQLSEKAKELSHFMTKPHKPRYIAKQFLFHGFVPLADFKGIKEGEDVAYITSSTTLDGITYIFPKKLHMAARPGKQPDKRHLWYQFESGLTIPGYTRAWYTNEIKSLKRNQDAQCKTI